MEGESWSTPAFRRFLAASARGSVQTDFPVAVLRTVVADALGAQSRIVRLSGDTAAKQAARHDEVTVEDYAMVQYTLDHGQWFKQFDRHAAGFASTENGLWRAVIKATEDRLETYLVSLHRVRSRDLRSARRRWQEIQR